MPQATEWTKETFNATLWVPDSMPDATGALLLSTGFFLLLSTGDTLGIYNP